MSQGRRQSKLKFSFSVYSVASCSNRQKRTSRRACRYEIELLSVQFRRRVVLVFGLEMLQAAVGDDVLGVLERAVWPIERDVMAEVGQPILSLVSRVFLNGPEGIIPQLTRPGPRGCRHEQHPQKMLDVALAVVRSLFTQAEEPVDGIALTGQE